MIGVIVNTLAVALGGLLGTVFGHRMSRDFTEKLNTVFGICALGMGVSSVTQMQNMPAVILAVVLGTAIGLAMHLGDLIAGCGLLLQKPISRLLGEKSHGSLTGDEYISLLVTTMVLFCSSGTGIYGCLDAGMTGDSTILLSKSVLDFFTAIVFACNLGPVVAVVALPQFAVFFILFLCSKAVVPLTNPIMIADFKACGGFMLLATGCRIAKMKEFPIGDMLPGMILVMPLSAIWVNYIVPFL